MNIPCEQVLERTYFGPEARQLLDQLPHPIGIADPVGKIVFCNSSYLALGGFHLGEILNRRVYDFWFDCRRPDHSAVADQMHRRYRDRLAGKDEIYEMPFTARDGTRLEVELYGAPLRATDGTSIGSFGFLQDVSSRRSLERRLSNLVSVPAGSASLNGSEFALMRAHDLRNCMMVINGRAALMSNSRATPAALVRHMQLFSEAARLAAVQLQSGRRTNSAAVDPVRACQELQAGVEAVASPLISVRWHLPKTAVRIGISSYDFSQVLLNLVFNAVDSIDGAGAVRITLEEVRFGCPQLLRLLGATETSFIRIDVSDTGSGIDPKHLDKIFERDFTTKEFGSGLGLWSVLRHVSAAGGAIDLISARGKGSTFSIFLPLAGAAVRTPAN